MVKKVHQVTSKSVSLLNPIDLQDLIYKPGKSITGLLVCVVRAVRAYWPLHVVNGDVTLVLLSLTDCYLFVCVLQCRSPSVTSTRCVPLKTWPLRAPYPGENTEWQAADNPSGYVHTISRELWLIIWLYINIYDYSFLYHFATNT